MSDQSLATAAAGYAKPAAIVISLLYIGVAGLYLWLFGLGGWPISGAGIVSAANWERGLTIFNAFSAIGYAAVGALLGTQVKEVKVAEAGKKAAEAEKKAVEAKAGQQQIATQSSVQSQYAEDLLSLLSKMRASTDSTGRADWSGDLAVVEERLRKEIANTKKLAERALGN
jgi:hypothetical protein